MAQSLPSCPETSSVVPLTVASLSHCMSQLLLVVVLLFLTNTATQVSAEASSTASADATSTAPFRVPTPTKWLPNILPLEDDEDKSVEWKDVVSCCGLYQQRVEDQTCAADETESSSCANDTILSNVTLGQLPQFTTEQTLQVLDHALEAWKGGSGEWTQMTVEQRCQAMEAFFGELSKQRTEMVTTLMMEIGKNQKDAENEFDRTVQFAQQVIEAVRKQSREAKWQTIGSTRALVKHGAIGVFLVLAPFNYPLNECYAVLIPCLLMGNVAILKIPTTGGLVHLLTMDAFAKTLPPGTVNFIAGGGRKTMPPLMETGKIDGLGFIGGTSSETCVARTLAL